VGQNSKLGFYCIYGDVLQSRIQKTNLSCLTFSELLGIFTDVLEECSRDFPARPVRMQREHKPDRNGGKAYSTRMVGLAKRLNTALARTLLRR
jgi:hypothetical protein